MLKAIYLKKKKKIQYWRDFYVFFMYLCNFEFDCQFTICMSKNRGKKMEWKIYKTKTEDKIRIIIV